MNFERIISYVLFLISIFFMIDVLWIPTDPSYAKSLILTGIIISVTMVAITVIRNFKDHSSGTNIRKDEMVAHIATFIFCIFSLVFWTIAALKLNCEECDGKQDKMAISNYFEKIRDDEASLTAFFAKMPKGGDLHNHYAGAIYAESYLEDAISRKLWINPLTLRIEADSSKITKAFARIDTLSVKNDFADLKQRLLRDWSVKDYFDGLGPSNKHFFDAFAKFPRWSSWAETRKGLLELKQRAKVENTSYLELMIGSVPYAIDKKIYSEKYDKYNTLLRSTDQTKNPDSLNKFFSFLFDNLKANAADSARIYIDSLQEAQRPVDDEAFTMRYLISVKREAAPVDVFKGLIAAFLATQQSRLILGVNIVAPEDGDIALKDYKLHMEMFGFLHKKFPEVKCSLHAGELTLGLVRPEDLTWHIHDAVYIAGADRIGHGVDMPYEKDCNKIMQYMAQHKVAVEINLVSNEFILQVAGDLHPLMFYIKNKVPVVISTDDAGILRTNHTRQFVLLAKRYRSLSYSDIKTMIQNSMEYSFIKEQKLKEHLEKDLEKRFVIFEKEILEK